jgi:hypothetical protein
MYRRFLLAIASIAILALSPFQVGIGSSNETAITGRPLEGSFVPNEILIGLKPEVLAHLTEQRLSASQTGIASLDRLSRKYAVQEIVPVFKHLSVADPAARRHGLDGILKLTVPAGTDIFAMIEEYQTDPAIAYAEPNRIYQIADTPNDPGFSQQWGLHNTGQTGGRPDADIDAPEAWDVEKGKPAVLIAIVDTGVDYTHPDLQSGRVRTDIDRDFFNYDEDAMDDHGHGTYVAGIAAGDTHNSTGIAGVCQGCQILPVKVLSSEGEGSAETVAQGIQYAAQTGAKVISMSLGFPSNCGCSQTVARAINYAFESGSLLIAASGNDSDKQRVSYPASSPRVLAVGATDHNDQETDFSNRDGYLDIVAPGKDVYSLDLNGSYRTASGTSAATPFVSGAAGLILSAQPTLRNTQIWWLLYQSADDFPPAASTAVQSVVENPGQALNLPFKVYLPSVARMRSTFGRLNAYQALTLLVAGETFAPVDTCSGEPGCVPGCGAEVALVGQATGFEDLRLLRTFRDERLALSPTGQHWIAMYERHRLEVASILATDSQLRAEARMALGLWLPLIEALTMQSVGEQAIITSEHMQAAEAVMAGLEAKGSPELRADLEEARGVLGLGWQFMGADVHQFWSATQELEK